jgi:hypothetical protein
MWKIIKKCFEKPTFYEYEVYGNIVSCNRSKDELLKSVEDGKFVTVIYAYKSKKKLAKFFTGKLWQTHGTDILKNRKNIRIVC